MPNDLVTSIYFDASPPDVLTFVEQTLPIDRIGKTGNNLISHAKGYDVFGYVGLQLFIK